MSIKKNLYVILPVIVFIAAICFYYFRPARLDESWIDDFNYSENEIAALSFDWTECPIITIKIDGNDLPIIFDTGCNSGLALTNLVEEKVDYSQLGQTEQLNRDGSHRGWSKEVLLNNISVFGQTYSNVITDISDYEMFSNVKFNGLIGLTYFDSKIVTLDYASRKIAVSDQKIDYDKLDLRKYIVLPLLKSTQAGHENLLFFEAYLNQNPVIIYLDTGKNKSFIYDRNSNYSPSVKKPSSEKTGAVLQLDTMSIELKGLWNAKIAQVDDFSYPIGLELNSDIIKKYKLLFTLDLIEQKIIFKRL